VRAFIAIQLSEGLKSQIGELRSQLRLRARELRGVSWVQPDGIHLTLRFLGEIEEAQVGALGRVIMDAAVGVAPFTLKIGGLGAFPSIQRAKVLWLGVNDESGCNALARLQAAIEHGIIDLGFAPEDRAFSPHLTLARIRERDAAMQLASTLATERERLVGSMRAESVVLMRSQLRPDGAVYTPLVEVPLSVRV
jgi:2'-5' RNA ligase